MALLTNCCYRNAVHTIPFKSHFTSTTVSHTALPSKDTQHSTVRVVHHYGTLLYRMPKRTVRTVL